MFSSDRKNVNEVIAEESWTCRHLRFSSLCAYELGSVPTSTFTIAIFIIVGNRPWGVNELSDCVYLTLSRHGFQWQINLQKETLVTFQRKPEPFCTSVVIVCKRPQEHRKGYVKKDLSQVREVVENVCFKDDSCCQVVKLVEMKGTLNSSPK